MLSQSKRCTMDLLTSIEECNLKQLPTRVTNHSQSLIDLLLVSHPQPDKDKKVGCIPLTDSDHMMIYAVYNDEMKAVRHANIRNVRDFKRCNKESLLCDLHDAPWQVMDTFVDDKLGYWKAMFMSEVNNKHAPLMK